MYGWRSNLEVYTNCPHVQPPTLLVRYHVYLLAEMLDNTLDTEWLFYCDVISRGEDKIMVGNCEIPEQEVTYASVNVLRSITKPVVVHKHPTGIYSFSSVDDEYINANNDISLLWVDGEFRNAKIRMKTPCGVYIVTNVRRVIPIVLNSIDSEYTIAEGIYKAGIGRILNKTRLYRRTP